MKYYTANSIFKFKWDQITSAFWDKYPNPQSTHVLSEDTVHRQVTRDGKLVSKRILFKTNKLPKWGERFVPGARLCSIVEESIVDPKSKTLTTYTRNVGMTSVMTVEEKCVYKESTDNKNWTELKREAWVGSTVFGFSYALQAFGLDRFKKSAKRSNLGFEYVLNKLYIPETIPEVPMLAVNTEKLRDKAQKAKDMAKSKAASVIVTN